MLTNVKTGGIRCVDILVLKTKRGSGSRAPSRRRPMGVRGRSSDDAAFYSFFPKKFAFL